VIFDHEMVIEFSTCDIFSHFSAAAPLSFLVSVIKTITQEVQQANSPWFGYCVLWSF
jgi:hypothetical protein